MIQMSNGWCCIVMAEADLNSKIQILGRVVTVGKRYFGLYKNLVLIVRKVREFKGSSLYL